MHFRGVPYKFLPNTCAYSKNSPRATISWNSASVTKVYHLPSVSVLRGRRVVHETDSIVPGSFRILSTSVDLPEPEGPETISTRGSAELIRCFAPVHGVFRSRT